MRGVSGAALDQRLGCPRLRVDVLSEDSFDPEEAAAFEFDLWAPTSSRSWVAWR